jgi:hypothetical protein
MPLDSGNIDRAAYIDPQEMERYAQERTSANRVTLGTAGQVKDQNSTARGMELLQQSGNEKFAYIGLLMEFSFLQEIFRAYWREIYAHIDPQEIAGLIGEQRAASFKLLTPEEIDFGYVYEPQGIYTQESKGQLQAWLANIQAQYSSAPWLDPMKIFDKRMQMMGQNPDSYKHSPEEMTQMLVAQGMMQQSGGQGTAPMMGPQ